MKANIKFDITAWREVSLDTLLFGARAIVRELKISFLCFVLLRSALLTLRFVAHVGRGG